MGWAGRWRRLGVSAFVVAHLGATVVWVMPACPIRERAFPWVAPYILPLGLWQYWGMFAPDPVRETVTLEADVVDTRGLRFRFAFPKLADYSKWQAVPRFRHSKFAMNLLVPDVQSQREVAARHAVRQLALPAEAFPVDVHLVYQVRNAPPPGSPPVDPMTPTYPHVLTHFRFDSLREVTP